MHGIIYILCSFLLVSSVKAIINIDLDPTNDPDYRNLETVARLKFPDGQDCGYYRDYKGLEVMIETRDTTTKQIAWAGTVRFRPRGELASSVYTQPSEVIVKYLTHPNYFTASRNYGTTASTKPDTRLIGREKAPLRIYSSQRKYYDTVEQQDSSDYKKWMFGNSIFEWTLPEKYTILDLISNLEDLKIEEEFPKYRLYGYSSDGNSLNCTTFSIAFLEKMGVNISRASSLIHSYLEDYKRQTWWGYTTTTTREVVTVAGVGGGIGGAVFLGAELGTFGGPIFMGVGALAGGILFYAGGTGLKGVLNLQSNIRNAATPERFIREIYKARVELNCKVVRIRQNGGISSSDFDTDYIIKAINKAKGIVYDSEEITTFPPNTNFSDYGFNY